jgi:GT2 family glycosyltransferase
MSASPILAVMVLYGMRVSESVAFQSFMAALDDPMLATHFRLLIYDNSPTASALPDGMKIPSEYFHDPSNGGVAKAYNAALALAEKHGNAWLLLLDQDTRLNANYLRALCQHAQDPQLAVFCAAFVPKLLAGEKIISPGWVRWHGRVAAVNRTFSGIAHKELAALNSGTLLQVSAIRALGGFNMEFWLDYLDHWLFNRLFKMTFNVYVMDNYLSHSLSVESIDSMPVWRCENILRAERTFYQSYKSWPARFFYFLDQPARALKMLITPAWKKFFLPFVRHIIQLSKPSWLLGCRNSH